MMIDHRSDGRDSETHTADGLAHGELPPDALGVGPDGVVGEQVAASTRVCARVHGGRLVGRGGRSGPERGG